MFAADTFSRANCSTMACVSLEKLHDNLCHPEITRFSHLPYSTDEIKRVTANCPICSELKPNYNKPSRFQLIKATHPFEHLNIDYKGPLHSNSKNKYILTVIDDYSRFPMFPCSDVSHVSMHSHVQILHLKQ